MNESNTVSLIHSHHYYSAT